jgi:hypothetical protein
MKLRRPVTMLAGHWKSTYPILTLWIPIKDLFGLVSLWIFLVLHLYLVVYTYVSCRWVIFKRLTLNLLPPEGLILKILGSNCVENVQYLHSSQGPSNEAVISHNIGQ